jgi:PTS system N-acetylglucosamine-specific IIC component
MTGAGRVAFAQAQALGRALMLPIAVLPIAGLLLRLGQPDLLALAPLAQAGDAVFSNLPILFAIGVAVGFARDNHGVAGLAGAVGYLILTAVLRASNPKLSMGVMAGIISGLVAGALYNRYKDIRLPEYLAFFGGKRFVAIVTGVSCLALGLVFGVAWPPLQRGIDALGHWLLGAGAVGLFFYGLLNRLLLVTGLHHVINNLVWFVFGTFQAGGKTVTGDLHRFFAGDPTAGAYMTGFFPVMMFGLPAASLAMYHAARHGRMVGGLLLSMGLTSLLTGVTEPIEFSFMFLAPALYAVHAVLTGLSMALMHVLGVRLGFTFSAGGFDYLLSYGLSSRGWMLLPVGLVYGAVYYGLFRLVIERFDLRTPGREAEGEMVQAAPVVAAGDRGRAFLAALGGAANVGQVSACTTRLRLEVRSHQAIDEAALRSLGARGVVRPAPGSVQVVLGPEADQVADAIRAALSAATAATTGPAMPVVSVDPAAWLAALGGPSNLLRAEVVAATRLRLELADDARIDEAALTRLGAQGVMRLGSTTVHVVVGRRAAAVAAALGVSGATRR